MTLVMPATRRSTLGDQAFPMAAAGVWNAMPQCRQSCVISCFGSAEELLTLFQSSLPVG